MNEPVIPQYPSIRLMTECLVARGFTVRELPLTPKFLEFTSPSSKTWLSRRAFVSYPFISLAAGLIAGNKALSYQFAAEHGASIPKTLLLPSQNAQLTDFIKAYAPLVVKPQDSFSSHGMQLDLFTDAETRAAISKAHQISPKVLVQQQFMGSEVRFMVLGGEVVHCLLRDVPKVIGDGVSSVSQLIAQENDIRENLDFKIVPYPPLDATIIPEKFLADESIPAQGEVVQLNKSSMVAGGGVMRTITGQVDESYKAIAAGLASALNPPFMAVDLMIADYTKPATPDNYIFLEFTIAPSLRLYSDVRSGEDFDIATRLADMIEQWLETV